MVKTTERIRELPLEEVMGKDLDDIQNILSKNVLSLTFEMV